jgi:DNA-binding MarR family transcriptional regulator
VETEERKSETQDSPRAHYLGDRAYFLRDSELTTLAEVGTFRAITDTDLARFGYGGDSARMERELRRLQQQGLLTERVVPAGRNKTMRLLALTKKGARLVRNSGRVRDEQALYHGFAKPREAKHDADLYRLYQAQTESIARGGGRPTRVILDYELKRELNRDLAAVPADQLTDEAREEIAERHGLAVVDGKIPLPDLRIEYDTADMEHHQLDLELATRNYRPRALAEKAKAGFALFALREDASRLRRVLDEREITAEILSL